MKKRYLYLIIIIVIALVLRFWELGNVPLSLDRDEVALGYNAYSILHTGRDVFGVSLPPVLHSFTDYNPALYSYLTIPSIAVFGLTNFASRVPSAIVGIIGILTMYFFVSELFGTFEKKQLSLLSAFLLAISPWHLQFSRVAFEANLGLTCNLLIGLFFLKGLKKPWMLFIAVFFAGLNFYVDQNEWIFTPFLLFLLVIINWKEISLLSKKYLVGSVFICLIIIAPILLFITTNQSLLSTHRVVSLKEVVAVYLSQFDPKLLLLEGDKASHQVLGMGLLYLFDLPFLLIGIYTFIFGKYSRKTKFVIFSWLLLAPVPAAVLSAISNAVMAMNMLPMLLIFIALGYISVFNFLTKNHEVSLKEKGFRIGTICFIIFLAGFNFVFYLNQYFVQLNYFDAQDWQYGYSQVIPQIEKIQGNYKKIIVSNKTPMDQSYIFFLFYLRYPPQQYQQLTTNGNNLTSDKQFGKYTFRSFDWDKEKNKKDVLYIGSVNDFPKTVVSKETIYYPDGNPAMLLVDPATNL